MPLILLLPVLLIAGWLFPGRPRRAARWVTLFLMCAILLPILVLANTAAWTARLMLLEPSFHLAMLKKVNMYAAVPDLLGAVIDMELAKRPDLKPAQRDEVARVLRAGLAEVVPPSWVEAEVNRLVSGSLEFLRGGGPPPELTISLREPKAKAMEFLATQKIPASFVGEIKKILSHVPDEFSPGQQQKGQMAMALSPVRPVVQAVMLAGPAGMLAAMVLALLTWLVAGRNRGFVAWLGVGLLVGGIGVIALGMMGRVSVFQMTTGFMLTPPFNALPVQAWVEATLLKILSTVQVVGTSVAVAGALLIAIPQMIQRTRPDSEAPGQAAPPSTQVPDDPHDARPF